MSGICGIVHFDEKPVAREDLARMRGAMAFWGRDGVQERHGAGAAFAHFQSCTTPEDAWEAQPVQYEDRLFVAAARLDNRVDLLRELAIPASEHARIADSTLLAGAYQRWGEAGLDHLAGDWHFAVWDTRARTLFLARDQTGNTSLYYHAGPHFFAFASSLKALLALPGVPHRPNMLRVAQVLIAWVGDGSQTGYEGLQALPASHCLHASREKAAPRRYWNLETLAPLSGRTDEDYFAQFIELYYSAVRCRLRSDKAIGATLSGGLDSGSVVALAGPLLAAQNKTLTAFTSLPLYDADIGAGPLRIGHEWIGAHATAQRAGVTEHLPVDSRGTSVLAGIQRSIEIHDGMLHAAGNMYWIHDLMQMASSQSIDVLLTGQYGNGSVSFTGTGSLYPHSVRGDFGGLLRALRLAEPNPWRTLKRQVLKPLLRYPAVWWRSQTRAALEERLVSTAINRHFAKEIAISDRLKQAADDPIAIPRVGPAPCPYFFSPGFLAGAANWGEMAAVFGLNVRDPTADRRLVEFCARIPDDLFRRGGHERWIIRQTMADELPPEVLHCKKKGIQGADLGFRIQHGAPEFTAALDALDAHELARSCVDVDKMRSVLASLQAGVSEAGTRDAGSILCRGLSVGLFLSRF